MYVNKKYLAPQVAVTRLLLTDITTVSTEAGWKEDEWDEELGIDTTEASDQT